MSVSRRTGARPPRADFDKSGRWWRRLIQILCFIGLDWQSRLERHKKTNPSRPTSKLPVRLVFSVKRHLLPLAFCVLPSCGSIAKSFDSFDMVSKVMLVLCALLIATPLVLSIPFTDADLDGKH